jgi:endonuclease/exonuclease/phosphatase family metal-dependent hydrolase
LVSLLAVAASTVAQPGPGTNASDASIDQMFNTPREIKAVPPRPQSSALRVVTWNIDRGAQLDLISSELAENPPDLCLLQEVDWNAARSGGRDVGGVLARRLELNMSYGIEFEELSQEHGDRAFIGQATLTHLPILKSRVLRFERQSGFWKPHSWLPSSVPLMQRRLGDRIALVTELEYAGRPLVVYNVHLESRSMGRIQAAQLDEILDDLKHYPNGTAAIIGGDLNTKYFPSVFLRKLEREGFHSATGERIERTHTIAMALDWIFARAPLTIEQGAVRKSFKGSDHYPVYAEVRTQTVASSHLPAAQ